MSTCRQCGRQIDNGNLCLACATANLADAQRRYREGEETTGEKPKCSRCRGRGTVPAPSPHNNYGWIDMQCPDCGGSGEQ